MDEIRNADPAPAGEEFTVELIQDSRGSGDGEEK
jgi:hypothetical protein